MQKTVYGFSNLHVRKRRALGTTLRVMKLTVLLLIVGMFHVHAAGFSQSVTIHGTALSLKKIFKIIKEQTGYVVFSNRNDLELTSKLDVSAEKMPLRDFMTLLMKDQKVDFLIKGNTIVISTRPASIIAEKLNELATIAASVSGIVADQENQPLKGVSVTVRGGPQGTQTDEKGFFRLANVAQNAVLEFSFVGYVRQTYKVGKNTEDIKINLSPATQSLDELVMVGYGSSKRRDLTGSVASVDINEVKNAPFTSIDQALSGKAAGVQVVQADGSPGGVAKIRIRGGTSLIGGNDPLYIIDGVQVQIQNRFVQGSTDIINPVESLGSDNNYARGGVGSAFARGLNTLAGLNLNDIESIDILKDASATAIYGSRAANGVVIITTKKGKKNEKPILEANYFAGMSTAITEKVLNADQYRAVMLKGAQNTNALRASQGRAPLAAATAIINDINSLGTGNTDWIDLVTRTGVNQNADISVRGGGTGSRYYTSVAYNRQTGTLLGTDYSRVAGKINLDNEITDRLRLITNVDYGFTTNNITNGVYSSAQFAPPTLNPRQPNGTPAVFQPASFGGNARSGIQNPLALLQGINRTKNFLLLGSLALEYEIARSLKYRSAASVNYNNYHQLNYIPSTVNVTDNSSLVNGISSNGGIATQAQTQSTDAFFENTLTWDKQINTSSRINVLVGTSWQETKMQTFSASGQGFPDDEYLNGLSSAAISLPPKAAETQSSLLSFYLRGNYALKERYLFTVTGRSDASSKFPKVNRVGYFPSAGFAWRVSEEKFLASAKWLNELKIRVSGGYTGTQNLGDNLFYTLFTPLAYASQNAMAPTQLGNNRIKWESTLQKDMGVDFAMFDSRVRGALGYYDKRTSGLLMAYGVPASSGFSSALVNLADVSNRGIEIDLRTEVLRSKNISWNIAVNISGNRSKVTNINNDFQDPMKLGSADPYLNSQASIGNTVLREGEPVGLIYGYKYLGVIKSQKDLDDYRAKTLYAQTGFLPNLGIGYSMYQSYDTGTYAGLFKRDVIGRGEPKFYGGITNTVNFQQFSLSTLFTFSYGGDILYLPDQKSLGLGDRANRNTRILRDRYSAENPDADLPVLLLGDNGAMGAGLSSLHVHDASFIRMKSITLSYELPGSLLTKLRIRNAMIYASGINLITISGYPGPDPEISNDPYSLINGYSDAATYPTMKQYSCGLRLGF